MSQKKTALFWFRNDLRLDDQAGLVAAAKYQQVLPIFIWDPDAESPWAPGAASRWWLHHALKALDQSLIEKNSKLIILKGDRLKVFTSLIQNFQIDSVFWNAAYEPKLRQSDQNIAQLLKQHRISLEIHHGNLMMEPGQVCKKDQTPYLVYTAFWKQFLKQFERQTQLSAPSLPTLPDGALKHSLTCEDLKLLPTIPWDSDFYKHWSPTEASALTQSSNFLKSAVTQYQEQRNLPAMEGSSQLSPFLHFGQIHPGRIWNQIEQRYGRVNEISNPGILQFCKELVWREFSYHLLVYFPNLPDQSMKSVFDKFPWKDDPELLRCWQHGKTGYPIVDAGMRQLWKTGWMHNRVRMIVASFLTKDLQISWKEGAHWFWDTLLDADLANNTQGWQWTAGCGFDAAPFFRIFNPITQGETFDPEGHYIKTWCPELKQLEKAYIHKPWLAPQRSLDQAQVRLGANYPHPIVDHQQARMSSLLAFHGLKNKLS